MMRARAHVVFHGRVQGVNFRTYCRQDALERNLAGWVRNRADGTVEAIFEGDKEAVAAAIEWNLKTQPQAKVSHAEVAWSEPTEELRSFDIWR